MAAMASRIDLNCDSMEPVKRTDCLTDLLIRDRKSVLFVGEGNFTFTVAFATLREHEKPSPRNPASINNPGIWDGIISTRYERVSNLHPEPSFDSVLRACKSEYRSNCHRWSSNDGHVFDRMTPPCLHQPWQYGVDALQIPFLSVLNPDVVWFQCPWLPGSDSIYNFLRSFLRNTWEQIQPGKYVCIGITKHERYVDRYELQNILGFWHHGRFNSTDVLDWYEFCGADQRLVKNLLFWGYHHQGSTETDIHDYIKDDHVTLVFRKRRQPNWRSAQRIGAGPHMPSSLADRRREGWTAGLRDNRGSPWASHWPRGAGPRGPPVTSRWAQGRMGYQHEGQVQGPMGPNRHRHGWDTGTRDRRRRAPWSYDHWPI